jgi:hypothetical protein
MQKMFKKIFQTYKKEIIQKILLIELSDKTISKEVTKSKNCLYSQNL